MGLPHIELDSSDTDWVEYLIQNGLQVEELSARAITYEEANSGKTIPDKRR